MVYTLDVTPVASTGSVGIPLDKQDAPYTGIYELNSCSLRSAARPDLR